MRVQFRKSRNNTTSSQKLDTIFAVGMKIMQGNQEIKLLVIVEIIHSNLGSFT